MKKIAMSLMVISTLMLSGCAGEDFSSTSPATPSSTQTPKQEPGELLDTREACLKIDPRLVQLTTLIGQLSASQVSGDTYASDQLAQDLIDIGGFFIDLRVNDGAHDAAAERMGLATRSWGLLLQTDTIMDAALGVEIDNLSLALANLQVFCPS
jgi:outer membrane lipoprotein SlyB